MDQSEIEGQGLVKERKSKAVKVDQEKSTTESQNKAGGNTNHTERESGGDKKRQVGYSTRACSEHQFMNYEELTKIVSLYQWRGGESPIDYLERLGGMEALYKKLDTNPDTGINSASIPARLIAFKSGEGPKDPPIKKWLKVIKATLSCPFIIAIIVVALISIILNTETLEYRGFVWSEGWVVLCLVLISSGISSFVDSKRQESLDNLRQEMDTEQVTVLRDGKELLVRQKELVVGDIVKSSIGGKIFADALLISGSQVLVDESNLTGETDGQRK